MSDLRTRLQRLRVHNRLEKLKRDIPPPVLPQPHPRTRILAHPPTTLPGHPVVTPLGVYQLVETRYPLDFCHGPRRLADLFVCDPITAARLAGDEALAGADLRALAFIDTETTGLAGGAGTLVFLVGVGVCEGGDFVLRQYFLADPAHEPALLGALVRDLAPRAGWVTFNGRAFDMPLLETRLTLNRQRGALGQRPHLDLLMPTRRLYRGRLDSCSLSHVEQRLFQILRDQADVPGALIPQMYLDYLRTGDPADMHRVIYHNAVDVLSMVTLAAHLLEVFGTPVMMTASRDGRSTAEESALSAIRPPSSVTLRGPSDWLRLARWHAAEGRDAEAEAAFRRALAGEASGQLTLEDLDLCLRDFAALLKRQDRRDEAVPFWEQLASFTLDDPEPFVELAKYFEWHAHDPAQARAWSERALAVVAGWPRGWRRDEMAANLQRRLERVKRKAAP